MADIVTVPHFANDMGVAEITIGVKRFNCIGARAPFDHPHEYLDMGDENEIVCPYCSTLYRYNPSFKPTQAEPSEALVKIDG